MSDIVTLKNYNSCYYSLACHVNIFFKQLLMIDNLCFSSRYNRGNNSKLRGHSETKDKRWGTLYHLTEWYGVVPEDTHTPLPYGRFFGLHHPPPPSLPLGISIDIPWGRYGYFLGLHMFSWSICGIVMFCYDSITLPHLYLGFWSFIFYVMVVANQ